MNINDIATNMKLYRKRQGMNQTELATEAGLSPATIKNIETCKGNPSAKSLVDIASALGIQIRMLLAPAPDLTNIRFRSQKKLKNKKLIVAYIARWLKDYAFLEDLMNDKKESSIEDLRACCAGMTPEEAAKETRRFLNIKENEPIADVGEILEKLGIKVLNYKICVDGFYGLSVGEEDNGPAILINSDKGITTERKIFSAVHELAHLILHHGSYKTEENEATDKKEEGEANAFAGYFLMPDEAFKKKYNEYGGRGFVDRVFATRDYFRVSYKTVLFRLEKNGEKQLYKKFNILYKMQYKKTLSKYAEPNGLPDLEIEDDRFMRLARKAFEEEKISLSRCAEILDISIQEMNERIDSWSNND